MLTKIAVFSSHTSAPELPLGGFVPSNDPVQVKNIEGLGPVNAAITSTQYAESRGELYQGSTIGKRNIVMTLGLNPNWATQTMSTLRQLLYAYFMPPQWVKLRFFSDHLPNVDIEGYVESFEPNMFSEDPEIVVSIICLKPDFIEPDATIYTGVVDNAVNEYVIDYGGSVDSGFELRIDRTVANPSYTGSVGINLSVDGEDLQHFFVAPVTINTVKYFKLKTLQNDKRVYSIAISDGATANLLPFVYPDTVWPVLKPGENIFQLGCSEDGQAWTFAFFNRYGGL